MTKNATEITSDSERQTEMVEGWRETTEGNTHYIFPTILLNTSLSDKGTRWDNELDRTGLPQLCYV